MAAADGRRADQERGWLNPGRGGRERRDRRGRRGGVRPRNRAGRACAGRGSMRDYWLSKLFYDLQDPAIGAEYREDRQKVFARYVLSDEAKRALEKNDVPWLAQRINPYLL